LNEKLSMPVKIKMFAHEDIAFYMHKNGSFLEKLER
jgi:hypothetical protein